MLREIEEELINESKKCLPQLKNIITNSDKYYKQMELISKPVLIMLLENAVEKIAELENKEMYDEMDVMDQFYEREFVFEDLVHLSIEYCELWVEDE